MLILIVPAIMIVMGAAVWIVPLWRPRFRFGWLSAVTTALVVWVIVWLWQTQIPLSASLPAWSAGDPSAPTPGFSVDSVSWIFAVSLGALALASLLTAPARGNFPNPSSWAITLALTALGLLAVTAANPFTLLLVWAALDLVELAAMLRWTKGRRAIGRAIGVFSIRASGSLVLMLAHVVGAQPGVPVDFPAMPAAAKGLLLLAAALHVGVLPFPLPYLSEDSLRRGTGTTMRLVSASASLVVVARVGELGLGSLAAMLLLVVGGAAAFFSAWMWLRAPDEIAGRSYWILGLACLSIASALQGNSIGAAAWGAALLLTGGILFLSSVQETWLSRFALAGAWSLSALPLSLTASGWANTTGVLNIGLPLFIAAQALLMAGYIRRAGHPSIHARLDSQPAWIRSSYPAGIWILIGGQVLLGLWGWAGAAQIGAPLPAMAATLAMFGLLWLIPRVPALNPLPAQRLARPSVTIIDRLYEAGSRIARGVQAATSTITRTLEGEAGIMWSLVLLLLFISLIARGVR